MEVHTLILKTQEIGSMNIEVERKLVCAVHNQKLSAVIFQTYVWGKASSVTYNVKKFTVN